MCAGAPDVGDQIVFHSICCALVLAVYLGDIPCSSVPSSALKKRLPKTKEVLFPFKTDIIL